jgi:gliding motility-associated-like protein
MRWVGLAIGAIFGATLQPVSAQVTTDVLWQRCLGGSDYDIGFRVCETNDGGFVCMGYGVSTDMDFAASHGSEDILVTKLNGNGAVQWSRVLGGSSEDRAIDLQEASDGSIMVVGNTYSNDGDLTSNHGQSDIWIVRLSAQGNTIWQRSYGGSGNEVLGQVLETADGGFLVHSSTESGDGDVVGFHAGNGFDNWLFKINAAGDMQWSRALGGSGHDGGGQILQTADGGILVNFSFTGSSDGDVTNHHGEGDCLLVKLNSTGSVQWSRAIGGSLAESSSDVVEVSNGDIMLIGTTASSDGDISLMHGASDVLLARLNSSGALLWARTYGGSMDDYGLSIVRAPDGGFVLGCISASSDGDMEGQHGDLDAWVLKVDGDGAVMWQRSVGGSLSEYTSMTEDADGGYLVWGASTSADGDVQGGHGGVDFWLAKLSTNGELRWQRCLGGTGEDTFKWIIQPTDETYVAFGFTDSNDGDVSGNHGGRDMWVVKLKVTEPTVPPECALYIPTAFSPNNSGKNDTHCLYGTDCITTLNFGIFDRWGNKVFESTDRNACWDGLYNGQPLDPAVFVYHLSATLSNGETVERQGNITLMR